MADGTLLLRQDDGTYRPVASETDHARLDRLSEDMIESIAASDPDHPGLDEAFWATADDASGTEAVSLEIDRDVLAYFREQGRAESRINAVLRHYVEARRKAG
ncbi:MAG: BrnA antitoxin family protein [Rhodoplanes sp.]|uniref:BrnA antitoxin family protein n=1 Tax=Rhodoplanes sp. TaxID=1968906 RepID=UPI0018296E50|nr:BrnA antitoxin family protein [Rhodoplanes sp.]NVO17430.1 BrnA antitoxin family protein [Rhodoplanes sp.]